MKNIKLISLFVIVISILLGTTALAGVGIINAPSGLVLREKADKTSNPITTLPDKAQVNIIAQEDEWYKVEYKAKQGYAFGQYVKIQEETSQENTEDNSGTTNQVVLNNKVKVYAIPVITSTVISEIEASQNIIIEKEITNWSYINAGEITGWVRTVGIKKQSEAPVEQTPEAPKEDTQVSQPEPEKPTEPIEKPETTNQQPSNGVQTEQKVNEEKGFIAVESANIRKSATTDSEIVTILIKGTSFTITAETEEWYKIKYTSVDNVVYEGYIYKELVTKEM